MSICSARIRKVEKSDCLDLSDDMADKIPSDFTVTADAKDFTIGNTFTYGSASLLNDLDLDDVDELDDLEEKLNFHFTALAKHIFCFYFFSIQFVGNLHINRKFFI